MKPFLFAIVSSLLFVIFSVTGNCQPGHLTKSQVLFPQSSDSIPLFTKAEIGIQLDAVIPVGNPYNRNDIDIQAAVKHLESGDSMTVKAFYYKAFAESPQPVGGYTVKWDPVETEYPWRVRFTLTQPGNHEVILKINYKNKEGNIVSVELPVIDLFGVKNEAKAGYLNFPEGRKHLAFTNGDPFFALGLNLSFYGDPDYRLPAGNKGQPGPNQTGSLVYAPSTIDYYKTTITKAADKGVNFVRFIFAPWTFELEWEGGVCGNYDAHQYQLSDLDEIIAFCEEKGVFLQICLYDHTAFKSASLVNDPSLTAYEWASCPIRKDLNLQDPVDFYQSPKAKELFKRRIRYILSRWGYSPNFATVELVSETNNFPDYWGTKENNFKDGYINIVNEWAVEMAAYCKQVLPRMLVTTGSHGFWGVHPAWASDAMDFASPHTYFSYKNAAYLNAHMADAVLHNIMVDGGGRDKPVQYGETGQRMVVEEDGIYAKCSESDITQIHFHNSMWSTSFMGSFGTSLPWSRTEIFAKWGKGWGEGYRFFKPLSKFVEGERFHDFTWEKLMNEQVFSKSLTDVPRGHQNHKEIVDQVARELPRPHPFYNGITTKLANGQPGMDIAAFGIKSPEKVIGWVQNMNNYWYNLNGVKGRNNFEGVCREYFEHPNEQTRPRVRPIEGATITINDLICTGVYDIEWWSTYDGIDTDADGNPMDDGGKITNPAILKDPSGNALPSTVTIEDNNLTVTIPNLAPLTPYDDYRPEDQISAPDYGFKFIYRKGSGKPTTQTVISRPLFYQNEESAGEGIVTVGQNDKLYFGDKNGHLTIVQNPETRCLKMENLGYLQTSAGSKIATESSIVVSSDGNKIAYVGTDKALWLITQKAGNYSIHRLVDPEFPEQQFPANTSMVFGRGDQLYFINNANSVNLVNFEQPDQPVFIRPFKVQTIPVFNGRLAVDDPGRVYGIDQSGIIYAIENERNQVLAKNMMIDYNGSEALADPSAEPAVSGKGIYYRTKNGNPALLIRNKDSVNIRVFALKGKNKIKDGSPLKVTGNDELVYLGKDGFLRVLQTKNSLYKMLNIKTLMENKAVFSKLLTDKAFTVNRNADLTIIHYLDATGGLRSVVLGEDISFGATPVNISGNPDLTSTSDNYLIFRDNNRRLMINYPYDPCGADPCEGIAP